MTLLVDSIREVESRPAVKLSRVKTDAHRDLKLYILLNHLLSLREYESMSSFQHFSNSFSVSQHTILPHILKGAIGVQASKMGSSMFIDVPLAKMVSRIGEY